MEYASGGELTKYVKDNKCLNELETKFLARQIQEGMKYIHSKNVIHRDLNPNNILFSNENHERLLVRRDVNSRLLISEYQDSRRTI